ncbi:hypothetical protein IEQ34_018274 [Dendrobium chrysotoxum]|uniref:Actin-related protein 7 n=1 Tax=Dendrobium chrysotoxum TaxID=161865 RepID=A0AAV7GDZ0_DENCH|nr:hypothetical protein IEQ34_018274 [Dendrobium chrysotoxum]
MEAVVVDAGSKLLKAGFAAPDQDPAMIIPTKMKCVVEDGDMEDSTAFEEVTVDPVVRGFIKDWDAMEDLLRHVLYTGLGWEMGEEGQILFTDPLNTPKVAREQLVQMMFETFNVSGFYASEQAVLSLYAVGRISGCTVDIGHGKIDIAPVCEGAVQHIASKRFEIGGIDLTNLLAQELRKTNPQVQIDINEIEKLKEQYACCAEDQSSFDSTLNSCQKENHVLPDGQVITIEREGILLEKLYFSHQSWVWRNMGLLNSCFVVSRLLHLSFTDNLLTTLFYVVVLHLWLVHSCFEERFQREAVLCSSSVRPSLVKPPEYMPENLPNNSAWMGGAILAKVVFPQNQHITKAEYDETGPSIVHRKCF